MRLWHAMKQAGLTWVLVMAWRDMRRAKRQLALFALAVVAGVAALVAINSFRANLESEMDRQSRSLLGADVEYDSKAPFSPQAEALISMVPAEAMAREIKFATMAYFPSKDDTRIVRAHAMEGAFPWYGKLDTVPAGLRVADSDKPVALLEDSLMLQFDLEVGDPIKIGEQEFEIIGQVLRVPGEGSFTGSFAPRVLIPLSFFEATGLAQYGSRLQYFAYQKFDDLMAEPSLEVLRGLKDELEGMEVDVDTVEDQRRRVGRTLDGMNSFLSMVGFVALLLGGVAIAGAVQVYLKAKSDAVATLRCLGASSRQAMFIYCIQISMVGMLGCVLGGCARRFYPVVFAGAHEVISPARASSGTVVEEYFFQPCFRVAVHEFVRVSSVVAAASRFPAEGDSGKRRGRRQSVEGSRVCPRAAGLAGFDRRLYDKSDPDDWAGFEFLRGDFGGFIIARGDWLATAVCSEADEFRRLALCLAARPRQSASA